MHELRRAAGMASLFLVAWPRLQRLVTLSQISARRSHGGSFAPVGGQR